MLPAVKRLQDKRFERYLAQHVTMLISLYAECITTLQRQLIEVNDPEENALHTTSEEITGFVKTMQCD